MKMRRFLDVHTIELAIAIAAASPVVIAGRGRRREPELTTNTEDGSQVVVTDLIESRQQRRARERRERKANRGR